MKKILFITLFISNIINVNSQIVILSEALISGDTLHCNGGNQNKNAVAYNNHNNLYYSNNPGGSVPEEYYDIEGTFLGDTILTDWRGMWYNSTTKVIEGNTWGGGLGVDSLSVDGRFIGVQANVGFTANPPYSQSTGAFDSTDNVIFYYHEDSLYSISRVDGTAFPTLELTGVNDLSNVQPWIVIYTGLLNNEIGLYNNDDKQLYLYNKNTAALSNIVSIPSNATNVTGSWGFSYANGLLWLFDSSLNKWIGYKIFDLSTTINEVSNNKIILYPNPSKDQISISTSDEVKSVEIFNLSGQKLDIFKNKKTINISNLPKGIYTVKVITGTNNSTIEKLIKN